MTRRLAVVCACRVAVATLACSGPDHHGYRNVALVTSTTRRSTTTWHKTTTTWRPRTTTTRPATTTTAPSTGACPVFPANNPWNTDITNAPINANSANYVNSIGASTHLHPDFGTFWDGAPIGIPFVHVGAGQPKVAVSFDIADESDPGPYPIPPTAPIDGGASSTGDPHALGVDDAPCKLQEVGDCPKRLATAGPPGPGARLPAGNRRSPPPRSATSRQHLSAARSAVPRCTG